MGCPLPCAQGPALPVLSLEVSLSQALPPARVAAVAVTDLCSSQLTFKGI